MPVGRKQTIMGIEIANVWQFDLRLYLKLALGELYKKDSKFVYLRSNIEKNFLGRGHSPDPSLGGERDTPSPPTPLGAFGASILSRLRRSNLAFPELIFKETTSV